jgi:hypothetical protein
LELGLNWIFLGLNRIDFLGFIGLKNPINPKKSILFNPKKNPI